MPLLVYLFSKCGKGSYENVKMTIRVEKVGPKAAQTLQQLWTDTFHAAYENVHADEDLRRYCEANYTSEVAKSVLLDPTIDCAIAYTAEKPAGFYVLKHHDCPIGDLSGGSSELKQIYVLPDHYGAGVGKALYDDALRRIPMQNRRWIWLIVSDKNERAQAFYRKQEFKHLGAGPVLEVGSDKLPSSILAKAI